MLRIIPAALLAACAIAAPSVARAEHPLPTGPVPVGAAPSPILEAALDAAWGPAASTTAWSVAQGRRGSRAAGPSIGAVGLGALVGLSEFEIGPSFRYWINGRFGTQAHLGFGGDGDFIGQDVEYLRFEPTFIVAIGDFGNDAVNVRPYAGGGIRVLRTDIGDFNDTMVRPAGVGGVELGFRGAPRLKVSGELSVSDENDLDGFNFGNGPSIGGVRATALVHYFFE